jgi:hypothetical protein
MGRPAEGVLKKELRASEPRRCAGRGVPAKKCASWWGKIVAATVVIPLSNRVASSF